MECTLFYVFIFNSGAQTDMSCYPYFIREFYQL